MRCMRCQGLMVWDRFLDLAQTDLLWGLAWRCVNCGEVLDAVIQSHRSSARLLRERVHERAQTTAMRSKGKKTKVLSPRGTPSVSEYARPIRPPENDDWKAARRQTFARATNSRNAARKTSHAEVLSEECGDAAKILKVPGRSVTTPRCALI